MTRLDSELEALLEHDRTIRRLPANVRARALAHARAAMAAAAAFRPAAAPVTPARSRRLWLALAASVCVAVGGAGAAAALWGRTPHRPAPAPAWSPPAVRPVGITAPVVPSAASTVIPQPTSITTPHRPARPASARESYAAELKLLKRAQAAYADQDFSGALIVVAEHARQFPNGRLAEEREALRVRSLASAGLTVEARHAAAAFADRFPRSALLPRLREALGVRE